MKGERLKVKGERLKVKGILIFLSIFIFQFSLFSCRPKGILHSGEMRRVLIDLHKTEGAIQAAGVRFDAHEERDLYYAQVLEKHGITQAQFDSSLVWYTAHPQFFNKIYPKVLRELEAEENAYVAAHKEELDLAMNKNKKKSDEEEKVFTRTDLDSVLWVTQHGMPTTWNPLVHDLEDELFPQIGVLR